MSATQRERRPSAADERILARARALVGLGWSRTALAEDRYAREVEPWTDEAVRWSAVGALVRAWWEEGGGPDAFTAAYFALAAATGGRVAEWNGAPWRTSKHVARAFFHARQDLPQARDHVRRVRSITVGDEVTAGPPSR